MKFHKQIQLFNPEDKIKTGSCYATAIACVLDLELHEVPYVNLLYFKDNEVTKENIMKYLKLRYLKGKDYHNAEDYQKDNYDNFKSRTFNLWDDVMEMFLASRGYYLDYIPDTEKFVKDNPDVPYFVSGKSARGVYHIVIHMNGKPYHDPHPSNLFLEPESDKNKYTYQALFNIDNYNDYGKYYKE